MHVCQIQHDSSMGVKKPHYLQQRTLWTITWTIQLGQIQHVNNGNVKILGQGNGGQ